MQVDVRFSFKRMSIRLCHNALHAIKSTDDKRRMFKKIVLPVLGKFRALPQLNTMSNRIRWFNRTLNAEQYKAVKEILEAIYRPTPYILFVPPGTGTYIMLAFA